MKNWECEYNGSDFFLILDMIIKKLVFGGFLGGKLRLVLYYYLLGLLVFCCKVFEFIIIGIKWIVKSRFVFIVRIFKIICF